MLALHSVYGIDCCGHPVPGAGGTQAPGGASPPGLALEPGSRARRVFGRLAGHGSYDTPIGGHRVRVSRAERAEILLNRSPIGVLGPGLAGSTGCQEPGDPVLCEAEIVEGPRGDEGPRLRRIAGRCLSEGVATRQVRRVLPSPRRGSRPRPIRDRGDHLPEPRWD